MLQQEETRLPPQFLPLSIVRAVWKRKLWVLLVWAAVSAGTFVVVQRMPAVYRAESLVLIEGQRIPERYVPTAVDDELSNRLSMLTQQIKSYSALLDVINEFDLYRAERRAMVEEEIIEKMRRDIEVKVVQGWGQKSFPAFTISYQGSNPKLVADVATRLTRQFRDQNLKMRGELARGTKQFLDSQLDDARLELEKQEQALSRFRQQYNGELPAQATALLGKLSRLEVQLKGVQDSRRTAEQQQLLLENSLTSARESLNSFREVLSKSGGLNSSAAGKVRVTEPLTELDKARDLLNSLRLRYSDDHPDVVRTRAQIERLEQAIASRTPTAIEAADESEAEASQNPAVANLLREHEDRVQSIELQLNILKQDIDTLERERGAILQEMGATQSRVESLPQVEQELAKVIRDYDISQQNYRQLLNQRNQAQLAAEMETLEKSERLVVLDMPRVPSKPIQPNREALIGMGCAAGLGLGVLLGFAIELRRGVLLGEWELPESYTVLGRVPPIKLAVAKSQARLAPPESVKHASRWPRVRIVLRLRVPSRKLVLAPTILLCVLGALVATSIYAGWSPF